MGLPLASGRMGHGMFIREVAYRKTKASDRPISHGPSGGGYGDPFSRALGAVLDNVLDGSLSVEIAREHYGVASVDGRLHQAATAAPRGARRGR